MNRKLLVTLLQKNIQELELITQGFMEMTEYPMPIILLAQRKTDDIQVYIKELSNFKNEIVVDNISIPDTIEKKSVVEDNEILEMSSESVDIGVNELNFAIEEELIPIEDELLVNKVEVIWQEPEAEPTEPNDPVIKEEAEEPEEITMFQNVEAVEPIEIIESKEEIDVTHIIQEIETSQPDKTALESTRKTILGERNISGTHTRNELLSKADNSISSTLANKKITDIKQAISIGDRFRFQRELFRGNGEDMNKTLSYINQLATLEEVLSFLKSKYGWVENNEAAEDFYQIVRRRFI